MFSRRFAPVALALTAYDIWRRIPPEHRRRILSEARKRGVRIATAALDRRQRRRRP